MTVKRFLPITSLVLNAILLAGLGYVLYQLGGHTVNVLDLIEFLLLFETVCPP